MSKRFRFFLFATLTCLFLSIASTAFAAPEDKLVKVGMHGDDVLYLQKLLADAGYYAGEYDGMFGTATLTAVQQFQRSNDLPPDGVVGKSTITYLQRSAAEPSRYNRELVMAASAYTRFDDGNGSYTYNGHLLRHGLVAVDPSVIPLGTRMYIKGYGYAIADDIGSAIKGNRIDLAYESRSEALQFGVQRVTVYILD